MTAASNLEAQKNELYNLAIVQSAFDRLRRELPPTLFYHVASHSEDVFHEALLFGSHDGLSKDELSLLAIAAAYHDLGFVERVKENEILGAEMAEKALRKAGTYTEEQIKCVRTMIIDTTVRLTLQGPKQVPSFPLAGYLLDADVSNLGREDFFEKADLVRRELGAWDRKSFLSGLIKFMEAHQWHSAAAKALRTAQKEKNLAELQKMLA